MPILEFLSGVPGVNQNTVAQQLAILKSSGDYRFQALARRSTDQDRKWVNVAR